MEKKSFEDLIAVEYADIKTRQPEMPQFDLAQKKLMKILVNWRKQDFG